MYVVATWADFDAALQTYPEGRAAAGRGDLRAAHWLIGLGRPEPVVP
jgi:hypothetical protein